MARTKQTRQQSTPIGRLVLVAWIAVLATSGCTYTQIAQAPPETVEYVEPEPYYYDGPFGELNTWGEWIETSPFEWVWRPYVDAGWQPYYHGNWAWTEWGWAWVSYEPFGWAAYHYGFWHYDAIYGWVWIPGDRWFPSRVSWMHYGDFVYWTPIPPPGYYIPDPWDVHVDFIWVGVRAEHFMHNDIGRYRIKRSSEVWRRVPRSQVRRDAPTTTTIEERTRRKIRPVDVKIKNVRKGGRDYKQMILPPAEKKSINRYEKSRKESVKSQSKSRSGQTTKDNKSSGSTRPKSKKSSSSSKGKSSSQTKEKNN